METKNKNYPEEDSINPEKQTVEEPMGVYINRSQRYSYADYLSWMDDKRRELYDGIVHDLFGAPTSLHAIISANLLSIVNWFIKKRKGKCKIFHAPFDVCLPKNGETADDEIFTVVQPDICVVCDPEKIGEKGCLGAPDLVVEVQSPSTAKHDLNEKFNLYEEAGVKEYWVVFPKEKSLLVFLMQENGKFTNGTLYDYDKGKVPVSIFKGLKIDLKDLFED
jgi:Uma2 family endonuclease